MCYVLLKEEARVEGIARPTDKIDWRTYKHSLPSRCDKLSTEFGPRVRLTDHSPFLLQTIDSGLTDRRQLSVEHPPMLKERWGRDPGYQNFWFRRASTESLKGCVLGCPRGVPSGVNKSIQAQLLWGPQPVVDLPILWHIEDVAGAGKSKFSHNHFSLPLLSW